MSNLGFCVGCRYAASQGQDTEPFVPAKYLVHGMGLCWLCAESLLSDLVGTPLPKLLKISGRAKRSQRG